MPSQTRLFMRCVSYCTAGSYDLRSLAASFKRTGYLTRLSRDVLQVANTELSTDVFFFSHGSFVCWGFNKQQELAWVEYVKNYSINPLSTIENDHFAYQFGEETAIDVHDRFKIDIITLDSDNAQVKLAISYGLAQAIKLEAFEAAIQETIIKNSYLPEEIANRGITTMSRIALFKRMGEIFLARSSINLNSEYLDTPEFFWRNPNLEPFYMMTKKFLDVPSRLMSLNQKLDVLQDLFDILNSQIEHRHSSMLEMIIILLILIEIIISVFQFHIF
jgi:uncharacterized Rmd1/YagE family protein